MAKYKRHEVASALHESGFVPLFYSADLETCKQVVKACYDGGARCFEFTNRGDFAHEIFAELNKYCLKELPGMMLGIGSIVEPATAALYIQLGAHFIVSPLLNPDMAKVCNRRKVLWLPGCATVSEVSLAEELGADIVKIFPGATTGGPAFVKNFKAPLTWSTVMPSGGVEPTRENITAWFQAGVTCVGMGSKLIATKPDGTPDTAKIKALVEESLAIIAEVKK